MLVSVIIPVYNAERYLHRCLDSVLSQFLTDIEILCVYDESTDNSLRILTEYQERDSRLKILCSANRRGLSAARNMGMDAAKGKYIFFLDSDDWISCEALDELSQIMEKNKLDIVFFDSQVIFEDAMAKQRLAGYKSIRTGKYDGVFDGKTLFAAFDFWKDHLVTSWSAMYSREFILKNKLEFYVGIAHEDCLFYIQSILLAERVRCVNKLYYYYYRSMESMTAAEKNIFHIWSMIIVYAEIVRFILYNQIEYTQSINRYLNTNIYESIMQYLYFANYSKDDFNTIKFDTLWQQMVFQFFLRASSPAQCRRLYPSDIEYLRKFHHIIIYGAGAVARRVIKMLIDYKVDNFHIAVSSIINSEEYVGGCHVECIEELVQWRESSMVIVAVSHKNQEDMVENLKRLGFLHWMTMAEA